MAESKTEYGTAPTILSPVLDYLRLQFTDIWEVYGFVALRQLTHRPEVRSPNTGAFRDFSEEKNRVLRQKALPVFLSNRLTPFGIFTRKLFRNFCLAVRLHFGVETVQYLRDPQWRGHLT